MLASYGFLAWRRIVATEKFADAAYERSEYEIVKQVTDEVSTALGPTEEGFVASRSDAGVSAEDASTPDDLVATWLEVVSGVAGAQDAVLADVHRESGISAAAFVVLSALRETPGHRLSMHLLAGRLGMTSGGFTKLADRLQAAELIERKASSEDRRVVLAVLTDKGAASADAAMSAYQDGLRSRVGAALPAAELSRLRASARRLAEFRHGAGADA